MKTACLATILVALILIQMIPLAISDDGTGALQRITRVKNNIDVVTKNQQILEISLLP
jgi:hypothetical protein